MLLNGTATHRRTFPLTRRVVVGASSQRYSRNGSWTTSRVLKPTKPREVLPTGSNVQPKCRPQPAQDSIRQR